MGLADGMKGRLFLVDETETVRRAALIVDGRLEALEIDALADAGPRWGSVYRAKITERMTAMGAAFVDLGDARGFLPDAGDALPGSILTVQVRREPEGDKAARVSTDIQVEHRLIVHTPMKPGTNVSKKITDPEERRILREALGDLNGGFVIRTAAEGMIADDLYAIASALTFPDQRNIGLVREGPDALDRLRLQHEDAPIEDDFDAFDIEQQIDALLSPRAELPEGAWLTIEPTTALVAVDVNTGQARGGDALQRVNLAAAAEIPRQLRLRHIGGAVAIDFAGGPKGKARKRLEDTIGAVLPPLGWGPAGWMELQTRKPGRSLKELLASAHS